MANSTLEASKESGNPFALPPTYVAKLMGDYFIQRAIEESGASLDPLQLAAQKTIEFAKVAGEYGA